VDTHYSLSDSDMFKRLLILSVCEKVSDAMMADDRKRLAVFLKGKDMRAKASACGTSLIAAGDKR
jgi:hypothetical protein